MRRKLLLGLSLAVSLLAIMPSTQAGAAACAAPATNLGSATINVAVPTTGTYRVWSRIQAPDTTNNSYLLEIDGNSCFTVGNAQLPANAWTWVDYQNGTASSKINVALTAGNHSLKLIGNEPNVAVDRVLFVSDTSCVPADTGSNCLVESDQTPPAVAVTAPTNNQTVSGTVQVQASANDASGISKVDFSIDGAIKATANASPYTYSLDTAGMTNGAHTIKATAYDKAGNTAASEVTVTVRNSDQQVPSSPTNLRAVLSGGSNVALSWNAATDNVGVTGYYVQRNNVTISQLGANTSYTDTTTVAGTTYTYRVIAVDAAGNLSQASQTVSLTIPALPVKDTQAPSAPNNVQAAAAGTSQVNLTWNVATDNVAVVRYHVYRVAVGGQASKIATVTTTSYGDTGLSANTRYSYYIIAEDASQNVSAASDTVSATTDKPTETTKKRGRVNGKITLENSQRRSLAAATVTVNGNKRVYVASRSGEYVMWGLPAGTYQVTFYGFDTSGVRYETKTYTITVIAGQAVTQNVTLTKREGN